MRPKILFVESTPDIGRAIAAMLERHEFTVSRSDDHDEAARRATSELFHVVVVEVKAVAEDEGLRFLREVNASAGHLMQRVVVISHDPPPAVRRELDAIGVCDIVSRPVHEEEILAAVRECLDRTPPLLH